LKRLGESLYWLAVTAWAGSLWTVGLLVAPTLFSVLDDRALAGRIAGVLFDAVAWIGIGCAIWLLVFRMVRFGGAAFRQSFTWIVLLALALLLVGKFGVQTILAELREQALAKEIAESVFRERFGTWHGVSSVLYLLQCMLAVAMVLLQRTGMR
jgi:hypothetical protein